MPFFRRVSPMKVVFSDDYDIDIGSHVYPTRKYPLVWKQALAERLVRPAQRLEPAAASWEDLALAHTAEYLQKVRLGSLSPAELAALEIPWSPEVVQGFRLMTGGTCVAASRAREDGICVHLGGGFHHGFANHGEGFCLFNDVAVAIRLQRRHDPAGRVVVIDCDVHHGNGTSMIFGRDPSVFTFSIHQELNYPAFKPRGSLDIGLADGTRDEEYLGKLAEALDTVFASRPGLAFYLAGADPYEDDQLGGLGLTRDGLRRRDRLVIARCRDERVPVVILLAGGYAVRLEDTVAIHVATVAEAARMA
jgi:acetoin utilization deacetylase AcuC-like enzyme